MPKKQQKNGKKRKRRAIDKKLGKLYRRNGSKGISKASRNVRPLSNRVDHLSGSDFIGKVVVKSTPTTSAERILATYELSPSAFTGTRLTNLASNWERYIFKKAVFRYVPAVPNTLACQIATYVDTDPLDDPTIITDPDALIRQAVAQTGGQQWNFIRPANIPLAMRQDRKMYYTGLNRQNERFDRQGKLFVIQVTNPIDFNGAPIPTDLESGSIYLDWEVCFQTPQIEPEDVTTSSSIAQGLFTTEVGRVGEDQYTLNVSRECLVFHRDSDSTNNTQTITVGPETIYSRATNIVSTPPVKPLLGDNTITWVGRNAGANITLTLVSTGSVMLEGIDYTLTGTPVITKMPPEPDDKDSWIEWAKQILPTIDRLVSAEKTAERAIGLAEKLASYHGGSGPGGWAPIAPRMRRSPSSDSVSGTADPKPPPNTPVRGRSLSPRAPNRTKPVTTPTGGGKPPPFNGSWAGVPGHRGDL